MRFIDLQEYEETRIPEAELDRELADEMRRQCRDWLQVDSADLSSDRCYALRPGDFVGQHVLSSDVVLRVAPKVPIANLFRMLEYAYDLKSFQFLEGTTTCGSLDELFDNLASVLAKRVLDRIRRGLFRDYLSDEEDLPYVRGRIDMPRSVRSSMRGSTRLACEYHDHTADLEDNRILAATLHLVPRMGLRRDDVKRQVRRAYRGVVGAVTSAQVDAKDCCNRHYHRLNEDYRPMHALCRFFLDACGPSTAEGSRDFIPYSLRMSSLFELFVARWLGEHLPSEYRIEPHCRAGSDEKGRFILDVDLVLRRADTNEALAVLDTKYKRSEDVAQPDVHQVVAYAEGLGTQRAYLIYPSPATVMHTYRIGGKTVRSVIFDIGVDPDEAGHQFLDNIAVDVLC